MDSFRRVDSPIFSYLDYFHTHIISHSVGKSRGSQGELGNIFNACQGIGILPCFATNQALHITPSYLSIGLYMVCMDFTAIAMGTSRRMF
jgi:hypothetical protein